MIRRLLIVASLFVSGTAFAQSANLPEPTRVTLDNGTVLLLIEKHDVPLIGLEAVIAGGAVTDPADKHGLANLLAGLLEKGSGDRSAQAFVEAAESVGGTINASANLESIRVSADFMAQDATLMVELVADMLRRPTLSSSEFQKLRDRTINLIRSAKSGDPSGLLSAYANAFLFGEHPYGNPSSGSEGSLANISRDDVAAYYRDAFGGDRLTIVVAGDFEADAMQAMLVEAFADWGPAGGELPDIEPPPAAAGGRVFLVNKPGATQTYFAVGNVGVSQTFAQRAELDLANTVFGGRFTSMLMTELRTKSGLSYSASSSLSRHAVSGTVLMTSFTETSTTTEALDVTLSTLGRFQDTGLSDDMITSARNYVMGQFPPHFETAAQLATQFAELESYGLDASYIHDYMTGLSSTSSEAIAAVIDEVYPEREDLVFIMIGDAALIRDQVAAFGDVTEIEISEPRFHP